MVYSAIYKLLVTLALIQVTNQISLFTKRNQGIGNVTWKTGERWETMKKDGHAISILYRTFPFENAFENKRQSNQL